MTVRQGWVLIAGSTAILAVSILRLDGVSSIFQDRANKAVTTLYDLSLDPKPGTMLSIPKHDYLGSPIEISADRVLIVAAGNCLSCSIHKLDFKALNGVKLCPILVVFDSPSKDFSRFGKEAARNTTLVSDHKSMVSNVLNTGFFAPRMAIVDHTGKILCLQSYSETTDGFLEKNHVH